MFLSIVFSSFLVACLLVQAVAQLCANNTENTDSLSPPQLNVPTPTSSRTSPQLLVPSSSPAFTSPLPPPSWAPPGLSAAPCTCTATLARPAPRAEVCKLFPTASLSEQSQLTSSSGAYFAGAADLALKLMAAYTSYVIATGK